MTSIVDEDDRVVAAALALLNENASQGTENLRRVETDDDTTFVYRIDPSAGEGEVEAAQADGEFPNADITMWRADHAEVEREADRRGIEPTSRSTAGETGGNR